MNRRTETDLREALRELERRADAHGAPSASSILDARTTASLDDPTRRHRPNWLAPLAAAGVAAAVAVTVAVTVSGGSKGATRPEAAPGGASSSLPSASVPAIPPASRSSVTPAATAAGVLAAAAARLDAQPGWTEPSASAFFYVHTTEASTWTSVSGTRPGEGRSIDGTDISIPGCASGQLVAQGESGSCTLDDVPHYRADAPVVAAQWDAYLERMAPGAKAAQAQGKIIVQTLHGDLLRPRAAAALLTYTESCAGLRTVQVPPADGHALVGVTCTSMTNGSYGLAFDATTHAFAGFVPMDAGSGAVTGPAEVILQTGIVAALGQKP